MFSIIDYETHFEIECMNNIFITNNIKHVNTIKYLKNIFVISNYLKKHCKIKENNSDKSDLVDKKVVNLTISNILEMLK